MNDPNFSEARRLKGGKEPGQISPWEWAAAAVGAVLVFGSISVLIYDAVRHPSSPPQVEVVVDAITNMGTGYVVEFWAHNRGRTTAAGLTIEGELKRGPVSLEKSSVTIDYVPAEARRQGGLFFSNDPRQYRLEIRPKGYDRP